MIFSSQDPASKRFVEFLSVMLAGINIALFCWNIMHWLLALKRESAKEKQRKLAEDLANGELHLNRETMWDAFGDKVKRIRSRMMSEEKRQTRTRRRTFDSSDPTNRSRSNPLEEENSTSIQMIELGEGAGGGGGEVGEGGNGGGGSRGGVRREENQRVNVANVPRRSTASFMEAPPPAPIRSSENQQGNVANVPRRSTASFMEAPPPAPIRSSGDVVSMNDNPMRNKRGI